MRKELILFGLSLGVVAASQTACSKQNQDTITETIQQENDTTDLTEENEQEELMNGSDDVTGSEDSTKDIETNDEAILEQFEALTSVDNTDLTEIIAFMEKNIEAVSKENASAMLLKLEELQIASRTVLEEKFMPDKIQEKLLGAMLAGKEYSNPDIYEDEAIKTLLLETKKSGFALDQAEGFVYPIINYSIYEAFCEFATDDIAEYFKIMVTESSKPFAKDAALLIDWDEVVNRALVAEKFLTKFSTSQKIDAVKELYQRYESVALYGLNNTPLFDYEDQTMDQEAKSAYEKAIASADGSSDFLNTIKNYMEVLKKANYKLTKEVEEYRNSLTK